MMASRTLAGLRQAARVCCDSHATRDALIATGAMNAERVSVIPLPVHPAFSPTADAAADTLAKALLGGEGRWLDILHVGSTIARKRIDVLLRVIGGLRDRFPGVRLVRVGGPFTREQADQVGALNLSAQVRVLPRLTRRVLAAVYRSATLVLVPSEREGFGLPVAESLACGTPVVASDLPALREVAADAAMHCGVGDVRGWVDAVTGLLDERQLDRAAWARRRRRGLARAQAFGYPEFARQLTAVYSTLA
jgi:glycosyltransferase involved in cell wall biosynthesis